MGPPLSTATAALVLYSNQTKLQSLERGCEIIV